MAYALTTTGCGDNGTGPGDGNDTTTVDSVTFSDDILPIFINNCAGAGCHVPGPDPSTGLSLKDYASAMAGSNNGAVIKPGLAKNSPLVLRLRGTIQPSMPLGRSQLPEATIRDIELWINRGALDD